MTELFNTLAISTNVCDGDTLFVFQIARLIIRILQIAVPFALIIWGSLDLLKGIIAGDEKKISAARKPFIQRLISAVIVFLLPWVVNLVIGFASEDGNNDWKDCWKAAWKNGPSNLGGEGDDLWK